MLGFKWFFLCFQPFIVLVNYSAKYVRGWWRRTWKKFHMLNFEKWLMDDCYVLTCWPGQKCHSRWCTGRKWHILMAVMRGNRVGGKWLMKWDEVKKIPLYSHRLTHRKRVTSELHESYFNSITITQAIPKIAEVTYPDCQISEEIAEAWKRVHITAWKFKGNIRPTNWTEGSTGALGISDWIRV